MWIKMMSPVGETSSCRAAAAEFNRNPEQKAIPRVGEQEVCALCGLRRDGCQPYAFEEIISLSKKSVA